MDQFTRYRTTDIDLYSREDLTHLAAALESQGLVISRRLTQFDSGTWHCGFNLRSDEEYAEPEPQIAVILSIIEQLDSSMRKVWDHCTSRLFDLGYECVRGPFSFYQELSPTTLTRLATVGATMRITLYSDPDPNEDELDLE